MSDQLLITPTKPRGALRARPPALSTKPPSPARHSRQMDELLSQLVPATVVEALQSPTGPLKTCLDHASTSEQTFALKTAIVSQTIHHWLDEVSDWPWPSTKKRNGFEMPPASTIKPIEPDTSIDSHEGILPSSGDYFGSLPTKDVISHEKRIEQIRQEIESLDIEEIKKQVLRNHIVPLSRPGTPYSDAGVSVASAFSFVKMEDLSAVVTAITVRALPALSKLLKLLHTWNLRLIVLRKVPSLLTMLTDAEVALLSGWSAIGLPSSIPIDPTGRPGDVESSMTHLSRNEFDVIKTVLQQKVASLGRDLDFMLDTLEGSEDILPGAWLDRMESIEHDYAEWVTTAERIMMKETLMPLNAKPRDPTSIAMSTGQGSSDDEPLAAEQHPDSAATSVVANRPKVFVSKVTSQPNSSSRKASDRSVITRDKKPKAGLQQSSEDAVPTKANSRNTTAISSNILGPKTAKKTRNSTPDRAGEPLDSRHKKHQNIATPEANRNTVRATTNQSPKHDALLKPPVDEEFEPSILESVNEEEEEPELPPTYLQARKTSGHSVASMIYHGSSAYSPDYFDRDTYCEVSADTELPLLRNPDEPFSSDVISPPSSPPLRYKPTTTSVPFRDIPEIVSLPPTEYSPPRTPLEPSPVFDVDTSFEWDGQFPSANNMNSIGTINDDDHLQKQLRQLLETIPAKIELKKRGINLNPPDLVLPSRPKPRHSEPSRRPNSSLSSRTDSRGVTPSYSRSATPSFMLAPVRDTRPRSTSSQGIRLYHLSRPGELPIKLFIRCVGEQNERVMVRVGGGWADLGEYLRDYATHHGSRSKGEGKVEVIDAPPMARKRTGSSPGTQPGSSPERPMTPLVIRKTRKSPAGEGVAKVPNTPLANAAKLQENLYTPASGASITSRASSQRDWDEEDASLGLAGPKANKRREISQESRAWIESVKHKVRLASGDRLTTAISLEQLRPSSSLLTQGLQRKASDEKFGQMGKAGSTQRVFRRT